MLAAAYMAPLWAVSHLPTTDGPSHVYNSWLLLELAHPATAASPADPFEINWQPLPNWLSTTILCGLLRVAPPLVAEKLLASSYVALLALAFWTLAGAVAPERHWLAFFAFPFVYNELLTMGFYNFCLSLAFYMLAVAVWWRRRDRPGIGTALALNALLTVCYFSHIVSLLMALLTIGVLWLATWRRETMRRHLGHVAGLAPQIVLPAWFLLTHRHAPAIASTQHADVLLSRLVTLDVLRSFGAAPWVGVAVSATLAAALVATVVARWLAARRQAARRAGGEPWLRPEDGFLAVAGLATVVYFVAPDGLAGGSLLLPRLSLFPYVAVLPWLAPPLPSWAVRGAIASLAAAAAAVLITVWSCFHTADREIAAYLRAVAIIPAGSRVAPLTWSHASGGCLRTPFLSHMLDYAALDRGFLDWANYEADSELFPVRFRAGLERPEVAGMAWFPNRYSPAQYASCVEYLAAWQMPAGIRANRRYADLDALYEELPGQGSLRIWRRRPGIRRTAACDPATASVTTTATTPAAAWPAPQTPGR